MAHSRKATNSDITTKITADSSDPLSLNDVIWFAAQLSKTPDLKVTRLELPFAFLHVQIVCSGSFSDSFPHGVRWGPLKDLKRLDLRVLTPLPNAPYTLFWLSMESCKILW
jgi:hypothetical protein